MNAFLGRAACGRRFFLHPFAEMMKRCRAPPVLPIASFYPAHYLLIPFSGDNREKIRPFSESREAFKYFDTSPFRNGFSITKVNLGNFLSQFITSFLFSYHVDVPRVQ
jgi:hypothetical protein